MNNEKLELNANLVVSYLKKSPENFTEEDIVAFVRNNGIRMVNFMYAGGDGRLKTLNFMISDLSYLKMMLLAGERVDGSSLFHSVEAGNSDLYVVPRYSTAFVDPFAEIPTLCFLCDFFDKDGNEYKASPSYILKRAVQTFRDVTGCDFEAMGELEYYVIKPEEEMFQAEDQHGYHESMPFAKTLDFRTKCMAYIAQTGGQIKYGHAEVGNFVQDGLNYEQNEIEFLPVPASDAADQLTVAKWVIRNLAYREGYNVTFSPKITTGKAGSGLHIHMRMMKDGRNMMVRDGQLTDDARRMIAGMMEMAPSLTAFGNKNPISYFRLVPHQEAPTNICWGISNRSALVRVPLGWSSGVDMRAKANPLEKPVSEDMSVKQTVELRSSDGSANLYQLIAGLCVACRHGFEMEDALEVAGKTYVDTNIHDKANGKLLEKLRQLPDSCFLSAGKLDEQRSVYEAHGVFSPLMIDGIIAELKAFDDRTLRKDIEKDERKIAELVKRYFQCG